MTEQKITPCLWFDFNAEEAVDHYLSIFPNSRVISTARYGDFAPERNGAVMTISFEIDGQRLLALNGGPQFKFTPALSLIVNCDDQAEIDALWEKLAEGGSHQQCGWLTDKFGVSLANRPARAARVPVRPRRRRDGSLHAGGDDDEEARHRPIAAGVRAELKATALNRPSGRTEGGKP